MASEHPSSPPGSCDIPLAASLVCFAPLAFLGNQIGSALRYPEIGSAVLFPPYAFLTAALFVSPRRNWVWYLLVDAAMHLIANWPQWSLSWVMLAETANITRALVAATLLVSMFGGGFRLDSIPALARLVMAAVVLAPAAGATIGAANVMLHGASETYWQPWTAWLVSNALTGLVMLPVLLFSFGQYGRSSRFRVSRQSVLEALGIGITLVVTCAFAFLQGGDGQKPALWLYAPLPALIWAAVRFGSSAASLTLSAVTFAAIWSVDHATGPFPSWPSDGSIFTLQAFVVLTALPVQCLAAVASGRENVVRLHRSLLASLQDHVAILDARGVALGTSESWQRFAESPDVRRYQRVRVGDNYLEACRTEANRGDRTAADLLAGVTSVLSRSHPPFRAGVRARA